MTITASLNYIINLITTLQEPRIDPCTILPITGYIIKATFYGNTITSRQISAFDQIMMISFDKIFAGNLYSNTEYNFSVTPLITELERTAIMPSNHSNSEYVI